MFNSNDPIQDKKQSTSPEEKPSKENLGTGPSNQMKTAPVQNDSPAKDPKSTSPSPTKPPKVITEHQVGKYKVQVIREKCISAASCVAIAPAVFELDEENLARIISQDGNDDETKLLAAQSCPTAAIIVIDTETGEQVWPV